jgi:hypothetical protein
VIPPIAPPPTTRTLGMNISVGGNVAPPPTRVILAGQPDQSQPRRRNSNTRRTPTMSITTSTAG